MYKVNTVCARLKKTVHEWQWCKKSRSSAAAACQNGNRFKCSVTFVQGYWSCPESNCKELGSLLSLGAVASLHSAPETHPQVYQAKYAFFKSCTCEFPFHLYKSTSLKAELSGESLKGDVSYSQKSRTVWSALISLSVCMYMNHREEQKVCEAIKLASTSRLSWLF